MSRLPQCLTRVCADRQVASFRASTKRKASKMILDTSSPRPLQHRPHPLDTEVQTRQSGGSSTSTSAVYTVTWVIWRNVEEPKQLEQGPSPWRRWRVSMTPAQKVAELAL